MNHPPTDLLHHQTTNQATSHGAEVANFMDLPNTMRQDYAQHEPMALFPEPSSTVANATQTQRRLLEGIRGAGLLGSDSESGAPQSQHPPQPSVPWSDLLNFSPAGAGEQSDYSNQRSEPGAETVHHVQASECTQDTCISQPVRRGSSVRLRDSPLRHELVSELVHSEEPNPPPYPVRLSQSVQLPLVETAQSEQNTQSYSRVPPQKPMNNADSTQNSDDELMAMGLPAEHYNPRPSRSRSLRVSTDESVDYSIRPEKALKGAKRRNPKSSATTTRSASANDSISTPQKVRQICEMGFTPTSTGKALKQNHGDVTQTIEWLINNGMGEDELAQPNTPKRRASPKMTVKSSRHAADESPAIKIPLVEDTTAASTSLSAADVPGPDLNPPGPPEIMHDQLNQPIILHSDHSKSPKVQVVIPSKSPRLKTIQGDTHNLEHTASKKPKRRKTTSDLPEPVEHIESPPVIQPTSEKRKRGRPKKVANADLPREEMREEKRETKSPFKVPAEEDDESIKVHQTIEAKSENITLVGDGDQKIGDTPKSPSLALKESSFQHPSKSSHTPEQATKTPSRSPTNKGKVSYRVGLSRRARIAPLLRTVKK